MSTVEERLLIIKDELGISKIGIGELADVNNPSQTVNNWIKRNSISKDAARILSRKTNYSYEWILDGTGPKNSNESNLVDSRLKVAEWETMSDSERNSAEFITVPVLDIELSAGNGLINQQETEMYTLPFRSNTLKREGIPCDQVRVVRVTGDSMNPRLFDGDTLSINMADNRIKDGKIYAIRVGETQKVKVLIQNSDGTVTVRSFNPDFTDEIVTKNQIESGEFAVLGRVWWISSII